MSDDVQSLREKLSREIGTCDWSLLAVHASADKLIVVAPGIAFLDAAVVVAQNDTTKVASWIESGQLSKLTPPEQANLKDAPAVFFQFVIVAPFVMAQQVRLDPQEK